MHLLGTRPQYGKVFITGRLTNSFASNTFVTLRQIHKVYSFARNMTFAGVGEHRTTRTRGREARNLFQQFKDTFQGKLSEFALYNLLHKRGIDCNPPDLSAWALGVWDKYDLTVGNKLLSVKSTKSRGTLLLLETGDYDKEGRYISVAEGEEPTEYDYFCLVRMSPKRDCKKSEVETDDFDKFMSKQFFALEITGFLPRETFVRKIIEGNMIVKRGQYINNYMSLDADNYYCQSIDLLTPDQFINHIKASL